VSRTYAPVDQRSRHSQYRVATGPKISRRRLYRYVGHNADSFKFRPVGEVLALCSNAKGKSITQILAVRLAGTAGGAPPKDRRAMIDLERLDEVLSS